MEVILENSLHFAKYFHIQVIILSVNRFVIICISRPKAPWGTRCSFCKWKDWLERVRGFQKQRLQASEGRAHLTQVSCPSGRVLPAAPMAACLLSAIKSDNASPQRGLAGPLNYMKISPLTSTPPDSPSCHPGPAIHSIAIICNYFFFVCSLSVNSDKSRDSVFSSGHVPGTVLGT